MKTLHFLVPTLSGKFSLFSKVVWLGCRNCIPAGNSIILRRGIRCDFPPIIFGHLAKLLWDFFEYLSTGLSKLHSSCPEELFELNNVCKSCRVLFITFGLSDKKILLSGKKSSPGLSKSHSTCLWDPFKEKVSFGIFFVTVGNWSENSRFLSKNFRQVSGLSELVSTCHKKHDDAEIILKKNF